MCKFIYIYIARRPALPLRFAACRAVHGPRDQVRCTCSVAHSLVTMILLITNITNINNTNHDNKYYLYYMINN